jgi:hypothetical protein
MTAKKSTSKKSNKIDYTEITEAEVQSVWPDLCMADRYNIAYEKVLQNTQAWKIEAMNASDDNRFLKDFTTEVIELAESDNFHIN